MKYPANIDVASIKELIRQYDLAIFSKLNKADQKPGLSGMLACCYALDQFAEEVNYSEQVIMFKQALNNIFLVVKEQGIDDVKLKNMFNAVMLFAGGRGKEQASEQYKEFIGELNALNLQIKLIYNEKSKQVYGEFNKSDETRIIELMKKHNLEFKASSVTGKLHVSCFNESYDGGFYDDAKVQSLYASYEKYHRVEFTGMSKMLPDYNSRLLSILMADISVQGLADFRGKCGSPHPIPKGGFHLSLVTEMRKPYSDLQEFIGKAQEAYEIFKDKGFIKTEVKQALEQKVDLTKYEGSPVEQLKLINEHIQFAGGARSDHALRVIECLKTMASEEKDYSRSFCLYSAAKEVLRRNRYEAKDLFGSYEKISTELDDSLINIMKSWLPGSEKIYSKLSEYKADLDKWRLGAKHKVGDLWLSYPHGDRKRLIEYSEKVRGFYKADCDKYKSYIAKIMQDCIEQMHELGHEPVGKFSIILFGSVARNEATPYSDLEFGILIENDKDRDYFIKLSELIQYCIMSLGESPVPKSWYDIDLDGWVPGGLCFDLGGKTSLGRKFSDNELDYRLIGNQASMASLISIDSELRYEGRDSLLCMELSHSALLLGNEELYASYRCDIKEILSKDNLGRQRALRWLRLDIKEFSPERDESKDGAYFNVKSEIYRLLNLSLDRLKLYYGFDLSSSWDVLDNISSDLGPEHRDSVKLVLGYTNILRSYTYSHYGKQDHKIYVGSCSLLELQRELRLPIEKILIDLYKVFVPWHKMLNSFIESETIAYAEVKDNFLLKGDVFSRIGDHTEALNFYTLAETSGLKYHNLGRCCNYLGNYSEAESYYHKAIEIRMEKLGDDHPDLAASYSGLAKVFETLEKYNLAKDLHQKAIKILINKLGDYHPSVATSYNNLASVYESIGNLKDAENFYKKSIDIYEKKFGANHPSTATSYNDLAIVYSRQRNHLQAEDLYKKALRIRINKLGADHKFVASTY